MSGNSFGEILSVTTFGESHGKCVGAVLDGLESGFAVDLKAIGQIMERRCPSPSSDSTPRKEDDSFEILSGLLNGVTTGAPLCIIIPNKDAHSSDYDILGSWYRPGHADAASDARYVCNDRRGGGRFSGRETAARVAAGAIALQILAAKGVYVSCVPVSIATEQDPAKWDSIIKAAKDAGNTVGGTVECRVKGLPAGLGEPVFDRLDAVVSHAVMSIPAVKGIGFGYGFDSENHLGTDFNLNGTGGVTGGLSTGEDTVFTAAIRPVPTVDALQKYTNAHTHEKKEMTVSLRHDICIVKRICPVIEACTALAVLDLWYRRYGR